MRTHAPGLRLVSITFLLQIWFIWIALFSNNSLANKHMWLTLVSHGLTSAGVSFMMGLLGSKGILGYTPYIK
jgi:NADH:ubiquinone oxidoreductase subunit 4 (subunit M)